MRKIFLLLLFSFLLSFAAKAQISVYSNSLSTQAEFDEMSVLDNNSDGKTWSFYSSGSYARYAYSARFETGDDYLFTPALDLKAGKSYQLTFDLSTYNNSTAERLKVMLGKEATPEGQSLVLKDYPDYKNQTFTTQTIEFTVEEDDLYYLSFFAYSIGGQWYINLKNINIVELLPLPGAAGELQLLPDADKELSAELRWNNPDKTSKGEDLDASVLTKIEVLRSDLTEPVYTIENPVPGAAESYTDNSMQSSGSYTYTVVGYSGDTPGDAASVTAWIGGGLELPYSNSIETEADFNQFTVIDANSDGRTWKYSTSKHAIYTSGSTAGDDYLVLSPLKLKAGKTYEISFQVSGYTARYTEKMELLIGTELSPEGLSTLLKDYPKIEQASFSTATHSFNVTEDEDYFIAFRTYSDGSSWDLKLRNIEVVEIKSTPAPVSGLTLESGADSALEAVLSWTNPAETATGGDLFAADLTHIRIYRNDDSEALHTVENPLPGETESWTDSEISAAGTYSYRVVAYNDEMESEAVSVTGWVGGGLELPYSNSIETEADFNQFTVIDANSDGRTWKYSTSKHAIYTSGSTAGDDYLVLPPLNLKAGKTYEISFQVSGYTARYPEKMELLIGTELSPEGLSTQLKDYPAIEQAMFATETHSFNVTEDEDYFIAFHTYSDGSSWDLKLRNIEVVEIQNTPAPVSDLTLESGADSAFEATLSWTNPTETAAGGDLFAADLTHIRIYRNDDSEALHTVENPLPGETESWTDSEISAAGTYSYRVVAYNDEKESEAVSVSGWIGGGLELPYSNSIAAEADFNELTVIDANEDGRTWKYSTSKYAIYTSGSTAGDDYLVLPPLKLKAGKTYQISFQASGYNASWTEKMELLIGTELSPEGLSTQLKDYPEIKAGLFSTETHGFNVEEDKDYYIAFRTYSDNKSWELKIKNIVVEEIENTPAPVSDLTLETGAENALEATLSWTNPAETELGGLLAADDLTHIKVFRNEEIEPVLTVENPLPGETESWSDTDIPTAGTYTYRVVAYNDENESEAETVSGWIGGGLSLPYSNKFTQAELEELTIIDANADGKTWEWVSSKSQFAYYSYSASDDWIITPPIEFEGEKTYLLRMSDSNDGGRWFSEQQMYLRYGTAADVESQTYEIADFTIEASTFAKPRVFAFEVAEADNYHVGLHLNTSSGDYVYMHSLGIEEFVATLLRAEEDAENEGTVLLEWEAPDYPDITFNIYRNGEKIADGITELSYTDEAPLANGDNEYQISVSYDEGLETHKSNMLNVDFTPELVEVELDEDSDSSDLGECANCDVLVKNGVHFTVSNEITLNSLTLEPQAKLTLTEEGALALNEKLILLGDLDGTATVTGHSLLDAEVQLVLPGKEEREWWHIASPVTGAMHTIFGENNKVGSYEETTRSYTDTFEEATELLAGKGYVLQVEEGETASYSFEGALNSGENSITLSRSLVEGESLDDKNMRGFNLVGNPYPSYISWEELHAASENLRPSIWFRTMFDDAMDFVVYNAKAGESVPSDVDSYIAPMQAFWLKVDSDPAEGEMSEGVLSFANDMRMHRPEGAGARKAPAADREKLRLTVSNGTAKDELLLLVHPDATDDLDLYDSEKMSNRDNERPEIYTIVDGQPLVINSIAPLAASANIEVALGVRPGEAGDYTIDLTEWSFDEGTILDLYDNLTESTVRLSDDESYTFTADGTTEDERFVLTVNRIPTSYEKMEYKDLHISSGKGSVRINSSELSGATVQVYNSMGQIVSTAIAVSNTMQVDKLKAGVYIIKIDNTTHKVVVR